jgi:hypothetical protein
MLHFGTPVEHAVYGPGAIEALEAHYARTPLDPRRRPRWRFLPPRLENELVPFLGAWLGERLVVAGGAWERADPLLRSRVKLGDERIDPWAQAWAWAVYDVPLGGRDD